MSNSIIVLFAGTVNAVGAVTALFAMQQRTCSPQPLSLLLWVLRGSLAALAIVFAMNVLAIMDGDPPPLQPIDLVLQFACVLKLLTGSIVHGGHRHHHHR